MSNAPLSWRETPDGWRWVRRASREITDGVSHVHLGDTNPQQCKRCKCYVHVTCINDGACLSCARPAPEHVPDRREVRAFHTSRQSGRPWLKYEDGMMHCAACRTYPQLGAQLEWILGIKNCKNCL